MIRKVKTPRNTRKKPVRKRVKKQIIIPWKWIFRGLIAMVLITVVMKTYQWFYNTENLVITNYELQGNLEFTNKQSLDDIIRPFLTENMLTVDLPAIVEELEYSPWVEKAVVYKRWPSQLVIEITEQSPIAFWGDDRLVNHHGEIFDATLPEMVGKMPLLYRDKNEGNALKTVEQYKEIRDQILLTGLGVSRFIVSDRGEWEVQLTNSWVVEIGKVEQRKRIKRLVIAYNRELKNKAEQISRIDLRYANGFAVKWIK